MRTNPLVPPARTAVMVLLLTTVKEAAGIPPKLTELILEKLLPEMLTTSPIPAESGKKEVITGTGMADMRKPGRLAVPPGVLTLTLPDVPKLTIAVMVLLLTTV